MYNSSANIITHLVENFNRVKPFFLISYKKIFFLPLYREEISQMRGNKLKAGKPFL